MHIPIRPNSAAFAGDGSLLYFQKVSTIGGLFRRDAGTSHEQRLLLKPGLDLSDLSVSPDASQLAASSRHADGVANIVLMQADGSAAREVTGGNRGQFPVLDSGSAQAPRLPEQRTGP